MVVIAKITGERGVDLNFNISSCRNLRMEKHFI